MRLWIQVIHLLIIVALAFSAGYTTNLVQATPTNPTAAVIGTGGAEEQLSPQDWIKEEDIKVYEDKIIINIDNPVWARFADTNSMDPVFDQGSNGLEIPVHNQEILMPGDIVTYKSKYSDGTIIHRIVFKGTDEKGTYYVLQGDNLDRPDPEKIYASENRIENVLIGIIY